MPCRALPQRRPEPGGPDDELWRGLARECRAIIARNRSTLFFVNSRRHAEKVARFINEDAGSVIAWAHHGSLSREMRLVVEQRLKRGELAAIVATSSLELGIDIGALDEVVLVGSPFTVGSAVQRLGRSGHRVGAASRAVLFPLHGRDLVDAAVLARCVVEGDIEESVPVVSPLDVLAQVIVSMTGVETWRVDELYDAVRASLPFHTLPRQQFDLVLRMLAGRYADTRLRELEPMVAVDAIGGTVQARAGALRRLYANGGTIPDRGYFSLRTADSGALLGELDEEFVWERSVGDTFVFGTQGWRIRRISHQDVEVVPAEGRSGMSPFWKAEEVNRRPHLALRVASALESWNDRLGDPALQGELVQVNRLEPGAADALVEFLSRQREATGRDLPHRHHVLVEHVHDSQGRGAVLGGGPEGCTVVVHTLWGGAINKPLGLAMRAAWQERFGWAPELFQDNDALLLFLPEDVGARELLGLVAPENLERFLRKGLEASGFFGARFRENAARALLLPRTSGARRMPLWLTRQRAKNLYEAAARYEDFPMLLETWRTCLKDEFDLDGLGGLLAEMASGAIRVDECSTPAPSPFCSGVLWRETNSFMYEDDTPRASGGTALSGDLVRELVLSADLRPRVNPSIADEFASRLGRTAEGWSPRGGVELLEWLKERIAIPAEEWDALLAACERDHGTPRADLARGRGGQDRRAYVRCRGRRRPRGRRAGSAAEDRARHPRRGRRAGRGRLGMAARERADRAGPAGRRVRPPAAAHRSGASRPGRGRGGGGRPAPVRQRRGAGLRPAEPREPAAARALAGPAPGRAGARGPAARVPRQAAGADRGRSGGRALWKRALPRRASGCRPCSSACSGSACPCGCGRRRCCRRGSRATGPGCSTSSPAARGSDGSAAGGSASASPSPRTSSCTSSPRRAIRADGGAEGLDRIFPDRAGRFGFWDLADASRLPSAELSDRLWDLAWAGAVSNDSFAVLRRGIQDRFRAVNLGRDDGARSGRRPLGRRAGFTRWQSSRPAAGLWYRTDRPVRSEGVGAPAAISSSAEELNRDRVRQLAARYGVLFRELLENELPALRWPALFRTMRMMELSGELVTGRFFDGIPGPQFALPGIAAELPAPVGRSDPAAEPVWWINACDPASLCGVAVPGLKEGLPSRLPTTHVVYRGSAVVLVSRRRARDLDFRVPADDPSLSRFLTFIRAMVGRDVRPSAAVHVESVNGIPALESPYRPALVSFGFVEDYRRLVFRASV